MPGGAEIELRARTAASAEQLAEAPWVALGTAPPAHSPLPLGAAFAAAGVEPGELLAVEATLRSVDQLHRPTLESFGVTRSCAEPLE